MNDSLLDNSKTYLDQLVGEGKKYSDPESLAKAYQNADTHIKTLEERLDDYRDQILRYKDETAAGSKLEDKIRQLDELQKRLESIKPHAEEVIMEPAIKPDQIANIVRDIVKSEKISDTQIQNFNTVKAKLTERFGDKYQDEVQDRIKELGISSEDLNEMARKSPALVFRTLGLDQTRQSVNIAPPSSSGSFRPKVEPEHKPLSFYRVMKKNNRNLYLDPSVARQMDRDAQALGESFFDVD